MDEYIHVLTKRLASLAFVSGESAVKGDAISRICSAVSLPGNSTRESLLSCISILRVFLIDWDRAIRSAAFRCFRYCLSADSNLAGELVRLSVDKLITSRLEASKSSLERAEILRFIAAWISLSPSESVVRNLLKSLSELLSGHVTSASSTNLHSRFVLELTRLICEICRRFPLVAVQTRCLEQLLDAISLIPDKQIRKQGVSLARQISFTVAPVRLPESLITPAVFRSLLQTHAGISILSKSLDATSLSCDAYLDALMEAPECMHSYTRQLLAEFREELVEIFVNENKFKYMQLLDGVDFKQLEWKYPPWVLERVEAGTSGSLSKITSKRSSISVPAVSALLDFPVVQSHQLLSEIDGADFQFLHEKLSEFFLAEDSGIHPFVFALILRNLQMSQDEEELTQLASLHGLDSELLWLLSFRNDPQALLRALESGWIDERWTNAWACDLGPGSLANTFASFSDDLRTPITDTGRVDKYMWTINGREFKPVHISRPSAEKLRGTSQAARELAFCSNASVSHTTVLLETPVTTEKILVRLSDEFVVTVDLSDRRTKELLANNSIGLGGHDVAELVIDGVVLSFEVIGEDTFGLIAVSTPRSGDLKQMSAHDWVRLHFAGCIANTREGCDWLRSKKEAFLRRAIGVVSADENEAVSAAWLLGSIASTENGYLLTEELGFIHVVNSIVSGAISVSMELTAVLFAISDCVNQPAVAKPQLSVIVAKRVAMYIPDVPAVPMMNLASSAAEAYTDQHMSILTEIDSLASSVHFKQKSAALTEKKSKNPSLFQSVVLWSSVMDRIRLGRFNLHARRLVHSLFIHTLCDDFALGVLDKQP